MNIKAFPTDANNGMDLRDYFAAKVLQAITSTVPPDGSIEIGLPETATCCYKFADAMMEARKK